ncbi:MAG: MFS transporter [Legionellaceae bacterium]|nr:MFS transporter [Legionellaceae bacterium]
MTHITTMNFFNALIVLGLIFIEWLDFSLYLYLANPIFARLYFPHSDNNLVLSFAVFAVAYLARPLGGWWLGRMADRQGRRRPMLWSALLMGGGTIGIGLLPGYAQWGLLAPWLLLLCRIAQGLALGGEVNTAALFLIEHHPTQPLKAGGLAAASGALGMFAGGLLATVLQQQAEGLWRLVFVLAGVASCGLFYARKQLAESPEFQGRALPLAAIWQRHRLALLRIASTAAFVSLMVYLCNIFWVNLARQLHLWPQRSLPLIGALVQLASALLALPLAFRLRSLWVTHLMRLSYGSIMLSAILLFYGTVHQQGGMVLGGLLAYVVGNASLCAGLYYYLYTQLPATCRCFAVSLLWAIAASIGALSLPVAQRLSQAGYYYFAPAMVCACAVLAYASLMFPQWQRRRIVV